MFRSAADVPTGDDMGWPGAANAGGLKDEDFGARRSEGYTIEIKGYIELVFGREAGVDVRWS